MIKSSKLSIFASFLSAASLAFMISSGVIYLNFLNQFVFTDLKIEITNNPITGNDDIHFLLTGTKRYECNSTNIWAVAVPNNDEDPSKQVILKEFSKQYIHNRKPGEEITNTWSLVRPAEITPGIWNVTMYGEFECVYYILKAKKTQSYNNIRLEVK